MVWTIRRLPCLASQLGAVGRKDRRTNCCASATPVARGPTNGISRFALMQLLPCYVLDQSAGWLPSALVIVPPHLTLMSSPRCAVLKIELSGATLYLSNVFRTK